MENTTLPTRVIGGHKAAINNPNVSEEAKEHSRAAIEEIERSGAADEVRRGYEEEGGGKDEVRVNAGYKATLKNPNVSEEAKDHAREVLESKDAM